jgi:hypothetical protein
LAIAIARKKRAVVHSMARMRKPRKVRKSGYAIPKMPPLPPPESAKPDVKKLSSKHPRTLEMVVENPTRADIRWDEIVALIRALGGTVSNGAGSRRRIFLFRPAIFHEPHPEHTVDKGAVRSVREFLRNVGVQP